MEMWCGLKPARRSVGGISGFQKVDVVFSAVALSSPWLHHIAGNPVYRLSLVMSSTKLARRRCRCSGLLVAAAVPRRYVGVGTASIRRSPPPNLRICTTSRFRLFYLIKDQNKSSNVGQIFASVYDTRRVLVLFFFLQLPSWGGS